MRHRFKIMVVQIISQFFISITALRKLYIMRARLDQLQLLNNMFKLALSTALLEYAFEVAFSVVRPMLQINPVKKY